MKAQDQILGRIGANMRESMGVGAGPLNGGAGGGVPLPTGIPGGATAERDKGTARLKDALAIKLERIVPDPKQPRKTFDQEAIEALGADMKARRQLQACLVRWDEGLGKWVLIDGERRYRAALAAGLETLVCLVETEDAKLSEDAILEAQLVANALREDLNPIEQAKAFKVLKDRRGCSIRQLAESLHISNPSIVYAFQLLDLPEYVQEAVAAGRCAASTALEASKIEDPEAREEMFRRAVSGEVTRAEVTQTKREVNAPPAKGVSKGRGAKPRPPKPRTFARLRAGKVVVEPKAPGREGILAALKEAAGIVEAEIEAEGSGEVAA